MNQPLSKDPLHGLTLGTLLRTLVEQLYLDTVWERDPSSEDRDAS